MLAVAVTLAVAACGDDTALPPATTAADTLVAEDTLAPADTLAPEDTFIEEDTAPPASNKLSYGPTMFGSNGLPCTSSCAVRRDAGDPLELAVQYKNAAGQALNDRNIAFSVVGDIPSDLASLSTLSSYTDDSGVARVTVRSYDLAGSFTVRAHQISDTAAGELEFTVTLDVPPPPAMAVSFQYLGVAGVAEFQLQAFLQTNGAPTCASVYPDGVDGHLTPTFSQGPYVVGQQARVHELPGLAQVGQQTWVVRVVAPAEDEPVASGCAEVTATYNQTAGAQVYVLDLPRHFAGTFGGSTRLDIIDGATGTAGTILQSLTELFTRPGHLLVTSACASPPDGVLATICNYITNGDGEPNIIGGLITDVLDAALLGLLESAIGNDAQDATQLVSEMLQDLRLVSILRFASEPSSSKPGFDGAYFAPGQATEEWTHVRFRWKLDPGCKQSAHPEDCGWASIPLSQIYGHNPTATLAAGIDQDLALSIELHDVPDLKYGPLVNAILEKYILPLIVTTGGGGQPIDSWDRLIGRVFAGGSCGSNSQCCQKFADRIYDDVPDFVYEIAPGACEVAIPLLAAGVRYAMSQLDASMHLGTPVDDACPSIDTDLDRFVDGYGAASAQCEWELYFPTGAGDFHPDTDWRATRQ